MMREIEIYFVTDHIRNSYTIFVDDLATRENLFKLKVSKQFLNSLSMGPREEEQKVRDLES